MSAKRTTGKLHTVVTVVAVAMGIYHVLYIGNIFQYLGIYMVVETHRAFHIAFTLSLSYLLFPATKSAAKNRLAWWDAVFAVVVVVLPLYVAFSPRPQFLRMFMGDIRSFEIALSIVELLLLFEAARRLLGWAMPSLAAFLFLYAMYGRYFPGFLQHRGFSLSSTIGAVVFSSDGVFGFITGISATVIIMFVMFGAFLLSSGGGDLLIKLASAIAGRYRGGPAKVAIVASLLFGTISGSTAANVATVGVVTIPLMKKAGYSPNFSAAVEAVTSNGGQFMPPVMGAVAFVMSEFLAIPYWSICLAALVPAILYYAALYIYIDIEAMRLHLSGAPASEIPSLRKTLQQGWVYLLPVALLIYFIMWLRYPPETSALYSMVGIVIASMFRKDTRLGLRKCVTAFRNGASDVLMAAVACITAGVIVSSIMLTGLGPKTTSAILAVSGGNVLIILALVAVACFIFGMGLSTMAIYLILVSLVAPALTAVGVIPLASHLFVFWWGLTAFITPPVCVAVFIACAIAGGDVWKSGVTAMRLGLLTYLLPFIWVYQPGLLLAGSPAQVAVVILATFMMLVMLGYGIAGFMLTWWQRVLLGMGSVLMLTYSWTFIPVGLALGAVVLLLNRLEARRLRLVPVAGTLRTGTRDDRPR